MYRKTAYFFLLTYFQAFAWYPDVSGAVAFSPDTLPVSEEYVLRTWEIDDGLPSNNVTGIAQTPDGYLWLATSSGLVRFDGLYFKSFSKQTNPDLESDRVLTLLVARDGVLWLGLEQGGVARLTGGHFETIVPIPVTRGATSWTNSLAEDSNGDIWFGHDSDLTVLRWHAGRLSSFLEKDGIGPGFYPEVYADKDGVIWSCTTKMCSRFDGTRFIPFDPSADHMRHLGPSETEGMWAVRDNEILHYYNDRAPDVVAEVGALDVKKLFEDREGNLWIGTTNQGLFQYHDGSITRVPTSHNAIASIFEDREGNLWVGTDGGGLDCLRSRFFNLREMKDGLNDNAVASVSGDTEGRLWLLGRNTNPVRATDGTNHTFIFPPNLKGGELDMFPDSSGGMWFGAFGGVLHYNNGAFQFETLNDSITAILLDRGGDLWAATSEGELLCKPRGTNTYLPQGKGLIETLALAEDPQGHIWAGTENGLVFRRNDGHQFVQVALPNAKPREAIRFIVPDENDTVWIGAFEGGLYRWQSGQVKKLQADSGLPADDLRVMAISPQDNFWLGTGRGLFRMTRSQLEKGFKGQPVQYIAYGRDDGLPSLEFSYGFRDAVTQTQDGHLWFATYKGALEVNVQKAVKMSQTPPTATLIEDIYLDGALLTAPDHGSFRLPPNPGPLQIHYTQPQMNQAEQIQFRYRLIGLDQGQWFFAGNQRTATFTNLSPGDYRFEVNAATVGGAWLPNIATLAFRVEAAWWQAILFKTGATLMGILALVLLVRLIVLRRIRTRMLLIEQENALERERTRIARDIHDQLGANLTQIHVVSQLAQASSFEAGLGRIQEVTTIARSTIKLLGEIVWAIDPMCDTLTALIEYIGQHAAHFITAAGLICEIDIPDDLPSYPLTAEARHHLLLVTKESLNNIVKHANATKAGLTVEMTGNLLRIIVSDNGRGFDPKHVRPGSNGLRNLRERMNELGGEYHLETRAGKGTRVIFALVLKPALK